MREIVLGTAGHVDHGKTSFTKALTGIDTDRLKEEKRRGITIELGFAYLDLPCGHRVGIIDVPGHEKFVRNMVAGVTGIDVLAFVIAADEGIMPQTKEHFDICTLLGVKQGFVALTKIDLVDEEWLELVMDEIHQFCRGSFLEDAPIVPISSTTGAGIDEAITVIDTIVGKQDFVETHGPFRLPIDRVFMMKGFGVVVTGTSLSGRASVGADLKLYPAGAVGKIRSIQVHSSAVEEVEAGYRTAINLHGLEAEEISRGMVLATPGSLAATYMLDCSLRYLGANDRALKHRRRVRVHLGTAECIGRVSLLDRDELQPGDTASVQLLLEEPVAVWPGDRFVIRSYSPVITIGGGTVVGNCSVRKRKRLTARDRGVNTAVLNTLEHGTTTEKIITLLSESGMAGLTQDELAVRLGLFGKPLAKAINEPLSQKKMVVVDTAVQRFVAVEIADEIIATIVAALKQFHQANPLKEGMSKEQVRSGFKQEIDAKVFAYCLNELLRKGIVVQEESLIRMADHQVALQADEAQLKKDILHWYQAAGLSTATYKETLARFADYPESLIKNVIDLHLNEGSLVKVSESLYFDAEHLSRLREQVVAFIEREGEIDAPRFKELSGLTRKYSIPILEYFDRLKLTMRIGDKRVLRKNR
jgi:selenocysteine-specific elongation factor